MIKSNKIPILFFIMNFLSIALSIIFAFSNTDSYFKYIALLPLFFTFISILNYKVYSAFFKKISITLIIICYYFRMVILPAVSSFYNFDSLIRNNNYLNSISHSVFLMIYEFFIVLFFCNIILKKNDNVEIKKNCKGKNEEIDFTKNKLVIFIVTILTLVLVLMIFLYPSFKSYFRFSFEGNINNINLANVNYFNMKNTIPKIIYWLTIYIINILQILIPISLLDIIYRKKINENKKFVLSIIIAILVVLISTPERARSIIISMSLLLLIIKLYQNKNKILIYLIIAICLFLMFGALIFKSGNSFSNTNLSSILQAYFSGVTNVSVTFLMPDRFNLKILFNDFCTSIPFFSAFFKNWDTSVKIFNNILYAKSGNSDQIIPMIGQGMYYFGVMLSPVISLISVNFAIKCEKKYEKTKNIYLKYLYIYMVIYLSVAPILYNGTILLQCFLQTFLPCLFIVKFSLKKVRKAS
ncbi:MAG: hypothetical protein Q4E75_06040 [bacterium]|nr:hypothetical protein [bacterium]